MNQNIGCAPGVDLAVVMPAYNEDVSIERVIREWWQKVRQHTNSFIFIIVDDGSTDNTPLILAKLRSEFGDRLVCVRQENRGHGQACLLGYRWAATVAARHIFQIDSDGQCDPHYFSQVWALRESSPLVYGKRIRRDDGAIRLIASAVLRVGVFLATGALCADPNVPYRLVQTSILAAYVDCIPADFFLANVALAVLMERSGVPSAAVPIRFRQRYGGQSSVRLRAFGRVGLRTLVQLRHLVRN